MSFAVISGRNDGYPCIPELDESISANRTPPYPDFIFRCILEQNDGYPHISKLGESVSADRIPPYPEFIFRCVPGLNDGYPSLLKMGKLEEKSKSSIYAGEKKIVALFMGNKEIRTAFCHGQKVFYKYFVKINA